VKKLSTDLGSDSPLKAGKKRGRVSLLWECLPVAIPFTGQKKREKDRKGGVQKVDFLAMSSGELKTSAEDELHHLNDCLYTYRKKASPKPVKGSDRKKNSHSGIISRKKRDGGVEHVEGEKEKNEPHHGLKEGLRAGSKKSRPHKGRERTPSCPSKRRW